MSRACHGFGIGKQGSLSSPDSDATRRIGLDPIISPVSQTKNHHITARSYRTDAVEAKGCTICKMSQAAFRAARVFVSGLGGAPGCCPHVRPSLACQRVFSTMSRPDGSFFFFNAHCCHPGGEGGPWRCGLVLERSRVGRRAAKGNRAIGEQLSSQQEPQHSVGRRQNDGETDGADGAAERKVSKSNDVD